MSLPQEDGLPPPPEAVAISTSQITASEVLGSRPKGPRKQICGGLPTSGHLCFLGVLLTSPHVVITVGGGGLSSPAGCELPGGGGLSCLSLVPGV